MEIYNEEANSINSNNLNFSSCSGCSKSGKRKRNSAQSNSYNNRVRDNAIEAGDAISTTKTIVPMIKDGGVYKILVKVNGSDMLFIFDTGASLISISNVEATYLFKQGTLTENDFIGSADFVDANGNISTGSIINLKDVTIGDRTIHNVKASVVNNSKAPLLLGQSAMEQFGSFSIDYKKSEITFK